MLKLKSVLLAAPLSLAAMPALAQSHGGSCSIWTIWNCFGGGTSGGGSGTPSSVPEIDASAGLLAVAAVLAVVAFAWERNRRRKSA